MPIPFREQASSQSDGGQHSAAKGLNIRGAEKRPRHAPGHLAPRSVELAVSYGFGCASPPPRPKLHRLRSLSPILLPFARTPSASKYSMPHDTVSFGV